MRALSKIAKRADEQVQYLFDFNPWLQSIASTATSFSVTDSPDVIETYTVTNNVVALNLTAGNAGETYRLGVTALAANGLSRLAELDVVVLGVAAPTTPEVGAGVNVINSLAGNSATDAPSIQATNQALALKAALADGITPAERTKLAGIADGATVNATDAQLRDRATHTGTQAVATVAGLQAALDAKLAATQLGAASGVASLDAAGKLTVAQLPDVAVATYLGDVPSEAAMLALPNPSNPGSFCTRTDLGTTFILVNSNTSLLTSWRQLAYPSSPVTSVAGKVGTVTLNKGDVGLANVDNTADADKPASTAVLNGLAAKATLVHSHAIADVVALQAGLDAKSAVGHTHAIADIGSLQTTLDAKAPLSHNQPISTVTGLQAALDALQPLLAAAETVSATSYAFVPADSGKTKLFTNAAGCSASLNTGALPSGFYCNWVVNLGAGALTFGGTATVNALGGSLTSAGELASGSVVSTGTDTFLINGALGSLTAAEITDFTSAVQAVVAGGAVVPVITGTPQVGQVLTATLPTMITGTFQWTRDGADIAGAVSAAGVASSTYTLVSADAATSVAARVSAPRFASAGVTVQAGGGAALNLISDDFADGTIDTAKWTVGYWRGAASAAVVSESSGQLKIPTLTGVAGDQFNGVYSKNTGDFTGVRIFVGNAGASTVTTAHETQFGVFVTPTEGAFFRINGFNMSAVSLTGGVETTITNRNGSTQPATVAFFGTTTHYWLGIKHNSTTGDIVWQYAPNTASNPPIESDWVDFRNTPKPAGLTLTACKAHLTSGTVQSNSAQRIIFFNSYNTAA